MEEKNQVKYSLGQILINFSVLGIHRTGNDASIKVWKWVGGEGAREPPNSCNLVVV